MSGVSGPVVTRLDPRNVSQGPPPAIRTLPHLQQHMSLVRYPFSYLTNAPEFHLRCQCRQFGPQRRLNGRQKPARRLWIPKYLAIYFSQPLMHRHMWHQICCVPVRSTCNVSRFRVVSHIGQRWQRIIVETHSSQALRSHLPSVPKQTKAGDIGNSVYSCPPQCLTCLPIQLHHRGNSLLQVTLFNLFAFVCGRNQPRSQRLAQDQYVSWFCSALRQNMLWMYHPRHRQPVLRFLVGHSMSARDYPSCLCDNIRAAAQNLAEQGIIQVFRPPHQVDRHQDLSAHRIDVAYRVSCCNRSKGVRVINDRREEVRRTDNRLLLVHTIDRRVIGSM